MAHISSSRPPLNEIVELSGTSSSSVAAPAAETNPTIAPAEGSRLASRRDLERRPAQLQGRIEPKQAPVLYQHTDAPADVHIEIAPEAMLLSALTAQPVASAPALTQLHQDMRQSGVSRAEFDDIVTALQGRHVESASAGVKLASLNDHVGIASFPFAFRHSKVATHLLVIKDSVPGPEGASDLYFIKGYANRLVGPRELLGFAARREELMAAESTGVGGPQVTMETYFCTYLLECSRRSLLFARRSADESNTVVMPVPPNAPPFPRQFSWANAENYMAEGFGEPPPSQRADAHSSDFRLGYCDLNGPENRAIIFLTDQKYHNTLRPIQSRSYGQYPASLNIGGGAIAQVTGFDDRGVEIIAPSDAPGVKNATMRQLIESFMADRPRNRTLIVRTEDQYRHRFEYAPEGLKMTLLDPHGEAVKALSPLPGADVSVYGWRGDNTGPYGSIAGYADPRIIVSTGEEIPAAPFLKDRHSLKGIATAASHVLTDIILNDLNPMVRGTTANGVIRTTLRALITGTTVYGMTALMNSLRDEKTHTLFAGARAFTGSGAGVVDEKTIASAIAVTVLAQDVVTQAYRFAYKNFVKDTAKSREQIAGQIFNEALLPFLGELGRLLLNYGIQTRMGLPRGNENDIYSLFGVATVLTGIEFLRGRSGDPDNHLFLSATYKAMDFFAADLVFRSLGAVYGAAPLTANVSGAAAERGDMPTNYLEAFVTRLGVRGVDKALLPILSILFSGAGLAGASARAGEDQLARENSPNNMVARVRDLLNIFSVEAERMIEGGRDRLEDIEALRRTSVMLKDSVENMRRAINHLNLEAPRTARTELEQVRAAASFHEMTPAQQQQHLEEVQRYYQEMIAASDLLSGRAGPADIDQAGPSRMPDLELAASNSIASLPVRIRKATELLMKSFPATYAANPAMTYPTAVSPDFISAPLPHTASPSAPFARTERIPRQQTTFTDAQVPYVKQLQQTLGNAPGMPQKVEHSNPHYQRLSNRMIEEGRKATHAYTLESQLFHYLLRWAQTGQARYLRLAPGVWFKTAAMNQRGNLTGEPDRMVTPLSVLMVNLMSLHAKTVPHNVYRAVVTDAYYVEQSRQAQARERYGPDAVFIGEGALLAMTEFMSVTSSRHMAATFLQGLGYGAAPLDRSQKMVIQQETAVTVIPLAEHMQVESLLMAGSVAVLDRIDHDPPPETLPRVVPNGQSELQSRSDDGDEFNLGQVLYIRQLDTFQAELRYHRYLEAREQAQQDGEPLRLELEDGAICCHPDTAQMYRYDAARQEMVFTGGTLNNFHGAPLEPREDEPARWRHPYHSALSPAQIRVGILGAILTGHPITPFLNDAVRNVSHEKFREKGGYYDVNHPNHRYKLRDDARRQAMKDRVRVNVLPEILAWTPATRFDLPAPGQPFMPGRPFPGEMLARTLSTALHRPMMIMEVDDAGQLLLEQREVRDHNDEVRLQAVPLTRRHFIKTHDLFDLTYCPDVAPMLGVGPRGYYIVTLHEASYRAVPVRISGDGLQAGNLIHAFLAAAYPNPDQRRYLLREGALASATDSGRGWRRLMPGRPDYVANSARDVLACLKNFARSDYDPIDQWLDRTHAELHGNVAGSLAIS
ncbi:hypothetical protein Hrubri_2413 [Herbaspirillum rubrisubalbicans M1]|uniref:hypothetical protein n=1 Tax=Herbaspirillum rubrisubalbicans TaxID=80842 RepID=UPI00073ADB7D|nr:hypothetical protein [Herbaspirillum rubrisubalbicans]ALU89598.1 hypothetical protein Hrubri_2413 [Herbaspirillum rubrisubalbicans M1]